MGFKKFGKRLLSAALTLSMVAGMMVTGSFALTVGETVVGEWEELESSGGEYAYVLVDEDTLDSDGQYMIVSRNTAGTATVVSMTSSSNGYWTSYAITTTTAEVVDDGNNVYIAADGVSNNAVWNSSFQNQEYTRRYLGLQSGWNSVSLTASQSGRTWSYDSNGDGLYTIEEADRYWEDDTTYSVQYIDSEFDITDGNPSTNRVYLYQYKQLPTVSGYVKFETPTKYTLKTNEMTTEALKKKIEDNIHVWYAESEPAQQNPEETKDYNISWGDLNTSAARTYTITITFHNKTQDIEVTVEAVTVTDVVLNSDAGQVPYNADPSAQTGAVLTVTYSDGTTAEIPVTVEMLSGDFDTGAMSKGEDGKYQNVVYPGLTVAYGDKTFTDFTLTVLPPSDYPEYPEQGAVRVNKTVEGIDFQTTGVAKVELSATGVAVKKGVDVIVMVDTSSSMAETISGTNDTRLDVLKDSLKNLVEQFKTPGDDGEILDIRMAITEFNKYFSNSSSYYYLNPNDHLNSNYKQTGENSPSMTVFTGDRTLTAGAFEPAADVTTAEIEAISKKSGTNYDYAFDAIYQLGEAITKANEETGEERDLFVIFMSDGGPFQFNYFSSTSSESDWNKWLTGTFTEAELESAFYSAANKTYYNTDGKHWMAEAIKGDTEKYYPVIRKNDSRDTDNDTWIDVKGLGATMYSIGFDLEDDQQITEETIETVLKNISSNPNLYYYSAKSADELDNAFKLIGSEITYAATNARFVDQLGSTYDLVMAPVTDKDGKVVFSASDSEIIVQAYDIYTQADVDEGTVTADMIGVRKGTSTVLETVTFNDDGTQAYSDKKSGNILVDGVICAGSFWYNTTSEAKDITLADGTTYSLPAETFYWNMGTVNTTELALSYYVYLTGANEGQRGAGSYATNEYATLYYDNYLGNQAEMGTTSPTTAWESASVSYAFYLVNDDGEIIVNQTTGQTGSFTNRVAVTQPVMYKEILLNNSDNITSINIASMGVLPAGYELYDEGAEYKINIDATSTGSWTIKKGTEVATTYVTDFKGTEYSNALTEDNNSYDYTHTTVWFAVKWTVGTVPDSVVIDYGLPVDITVLGNDMFGESGTLAAVGEASSKPSDLYTSGLADGFGSQMTGKYGTFAVNGGKVRYTPTTMQMTGEDAFAYAVQYNGTNYYYGTVTVIPATLMYYEEDFVTFSGDWTDAGTANTAAIQDEDRPGFYSLSTMDKNNLYGYDSSSQGQTTFSQGGAKIATVSDAAEATASFSFTGTGFDVISLTSSNSGTITVEVTTPDGTLVRGPYLVDTYYGYSYGELKNEKNEPVLDENGNQAMGWYVDPHTPNTLYQVPVMKVTGLDHGTYTAKITAAYGEVFDHVGDGSYDFYLDAVRVYDPANNGHSDEVVKNAYIADKEYLPEYMELRDVLINARTFASTKVEDITAGTVFIDGISALTDVDMYKDFGPNNELYLAPGQAVIFRLDSGSLVTATDGYIVDTIQLAMKTTGGTTTATVHSTDIAGSSIAARDVTTATEMYYDMTLLDGEHVLIKNTGNAILSVTNIKVTFKAAN